MIDQAEIISSLTPLNGVYFRIPDLYEYAEKITAFGKSFEIRHEQTKELLSYVLYYDNGPETFISMVWTHPEYQGRGFAGKLLQQLIAESSRNIKLDVHKDNPAMRIYKKLGFVQKDVSGDIHTLCR